MRTGSWLWTAALSISLPAALVACGDDSVTGGAGEGGQGGEGAQNPTGGAPSGGMGGSGGSGGEPPVLNDDCETATPIPLAAGDSVSVQGTLQGAADDLQTFCADDGTPPEVTANDVVYELQLAAACTLSLELEGSAGMNAVLSSRSKCDVDDRCSNGSTGGNETVFFHAEAGSLFVIVSDLNNTPATFSLSATCTTPTCGDFAKSPDEDCDDGNTAPGDGCDADCVYEPTNPEIDNCTGAEAGAGTQIDSGQIVRISDSAPAATTIGANGDESGSCQFQLDGTDAPDHVYKILPQASGVLTATLGLGLTGVLGETDVPVCGPDTSIEPLDPYPTGCYERTLYIRSACDNPATELDCSEQTGTMWWAVEETVINVTAGEQYFVFVDGYYDDTFGEGAYVLRLELE